MLKLRDYQEEAVNSIFTYFWTHQEGNPVIACPTGTGKSIIIAEFLKRVFHQFPNQKIMVLTHVKELIKQNYDKMITMWPSAPAGIHSAGLKQKDIFNPILFAGIASVIRKTKQFGHVDLIIIDEAHLVNPNNATMYMKFIDELSVVNPQLRVIGLTATPWRLGHGHITDGHLFTDVCFDITNINSFNRLIREGYLCPLIPKATNTILEVDGVHMRGGEFIPKELQTAVDRYEVTLAAIKESIELGYDRKCWLVFTTGIEHTEHTAEILKDLDISCAVVHSGNKEYPITTTQRDNAIQDLRDGNTRAIVNNNVLTTGFDLDIIDLIIVLRPTASTVLWVQMLGRGTRPLYAPGHDISTYDGRMKAIKESGKDNCLVLDFAGNTRRLGPINDPVIPKKKGSKGGVAPIKLCPHCNTYNHAGVRFCMSCDFEFKFETKLHFSSSTEELIKKDTPVIEAFDIDHITYCQHNKQGRPPSMKVSYYCGLKMFSEYVCIEHENFAGRKAREWWRNRSEQPIPQSTADLLDGIEVVNVPRTIRVWVNKKYPEITDHCFDTSSFNTRDPVEFMGPTITREKKASGSSFIQQDIPEHFDDNSTEEDRKKFVEQDILQVEGQLINDWVHSQIVGIDKEIPF